MYQSLQEAFHEQYVIDYRQPSFDVYILYIVSILKKRVLKARI